MEKRAQPGRNTDGVWNARFGLFELDLRAGELRKEGRRIRLQEQPLQILRILLESPGEVVTREEIRKRLWPDDTVVEFDHSINAAVKRLRDTLRDSADKPRYIETVARRGYRFIGDVEPAGRVVPTEAVNVASEDTPTNLPAASLRPSPLHQRWIFVPVVVAAILLIVGAGIAYFHRGLPRSASPLQPLIRLDVALASDLSAAANNGPNAILSPDGTRLVYVSQSRLFTRRLDQPEATALPGTQGAHSPFFSPDGQWVGFFAAGLMKKISLQSSQIVTLCENPLAFGGSWGEDGNIIAGLNLHLARVPSGGGMPTFLTDLAPGEIIHRWPQILPGGQAVLFTAYTSMTGLDGATIEVLSLKDRRRKTLVRVGTYGRYLPSGYLAYLDKGTLFAVPFALDRLEVRGTPTPILENVSYSSAWGSAQIDFSRTGTLVYQGGKVGAGLVTVQWLDQSGNGRPLIPVPGNYLSPTLSPDGSRLALTAAGDIWVYELGQGSMTRLTFGGGYGNPLWSPDGQYIVFRAAQGIWWTRADGTSQAQPLTKAGVQQIAWSFTGDGKRLAFVQTNAQHRAGLWTLPIATDRSGLSAGKEDLYLQTPFDSRGPMFSPDGRWIAYQSNESGTYQVYAQAFPDKHGKQQVSDLGGTIPAWSRNGHELFYWQTGPQRRLMVVSYQERGDSFITDKPRVWMESGLIPFTTTRSYDPAPDGRHIVALMPADAPSETHDRVTFLLNFFDELRRRAPQNPN